VNLAAGSAAAPARDPAVAVGAAVLAAPAAVGAPAPAAARPSRSLLAMSLPARIGLALVVCGVMWAAVAVALAGAGQ